MAPVAEADSVALVLVVHREPAVQVRADPHPLRESAAPLLAQLLVQVAHQAPGSAELRPSHQSSSAATASSSN